MAEKGEVFYLVAEELAESQVVEGADETFPEAVFLVVPDRPDRQGTEVLLCCVNENGTFLVCTDQAERVS